MHPDRIFLTLDEALTAIAIDFDRYGPQRRLMADLCPMVFHRHAVVGAGGDRGGVWMAVGRRKKMRFYPDADIERRILAKLRAMAPAPAFLAKICGRVFETRTAVGRDPQTGELGVWVETGMAAFHCRNCGRCCVALDYRFECTPEDIDGWQRLGRDDILQWVGIDRRDGEISSCQIWVVPGTTRFADVCPWLRQLPGESRVICTIHDVKPEICRSYPGTRKHARMTGCIGF